MGGFLLVGDAFEGGVLGLTEEHPRAVALEVGAKVGGELFFPGGGGIQLRRAERLLNSSTRSNFSSDGFGWAWPVTRD